MSEAKEIKIKMLVLFRQSLTVITTRRLFSFSIMFSLILEPASSTELSAARLLRFPKGDTINVTETCKLVQLGRQRKFYVR